LVMNITFQKGCSLILISRFRSQIKTTETYTGIEIIFQAWDIRIIMAIGSR
jgi:hypothetical protein